MTFTKLNRPIALLAGASLILLTACGGGGGGGSVSDFVETLSPPANPFDIADGAIVAKVLTPSENTVASETGTVTDGAFVVGDLEGEFNGASTIVGLRGGGGITLAANGTEYVGLFDASPQGGARSVGVIGLSTPTANLPSGSLRYTGISQVTIVDGAELYDLSGDVTVEAVLTGSSPSITTMLNNLDGTRTDTVSDAVDVTDVAEITISGSALDGAAFTNGSASLTSDNVTALTSGATAALQGGIFGLNGEEVGGVGVITDSVDVTFDFIGRR